MYLDQVGPRIREVAAQRWLLPEEIFLLLVNPPPKLGLSQTFIAPTTPQAGQIFVFDDHASFKQDGIAWAKKKGASDRLQETYMNLKVGGRDCIRGIYIKSAANPNFRRRIYRLSVKLIPHSYVLVHYRDCNDDEKPERHVLQPLISFFINQQQHLLNHAPTAVPPVGTSDIDRASMSSATDKDKHDASGATNLRLDPSSSILGGDDFLDDFLEMEMTGEGQDGLDVTAGFFGPDGSFPSFPSGANQGTGQSLLSPQKWSANSGADSKPISEAALWASLDPFSGFSFMGNTDQISVLDFAPNRLQENMEGVKFMVCLAQPVLRRDLMIKLSAPNNEKLFALEWISDTVAVWISSLVAAGHWSVTLVTAKNEFVCAAATFLEVLAAPSAPAESVFPSRGKRPLEASPSMVGASGTPSAPSNDQTDPALSHVLDNDRQFKIRLVEKLGHIQSALEDEALGPRSRSSSRPPYLLNESSYPQPRSRSSSRPQYMTMDVSGLPTPRSRSSSRTPFLIKDPNGNFVDAEGVDWLDDEVSALSNQELEDVMDRYIAAVVRQLVQLGSLDEDLRAEIDDVDSNGLSLLHYCCLYNLTSLIPVLLTRGADVNQTTLAGSSPLHLAVAAGNLTVTQELIQSGANIHAVDGNGRTAVEIARASGRADIFGALCAALNQPYFDPQTPDRDDMGEVFKAHTAAGSGGGDKDSVASMTAMLLQQTFSTLSLTDKCALSLSLGQLAQSPSAANLQLLQSSERALARLAAKADVDAGRYDHHDAGAELGHPSGLVMGLGLGLGLGATGMGVGGGATAVGAGATTGASSIPDDMSDIQSVISEVEKESLDAAMSMMGHIELQQVDEEVRKIQNNVRGWLLRKNFTNLREATKILQTAWRERKKGSNPASGVGVGVGVGTHLRARKMDHRELDSIDEKMELELCEDPADNVDPPPPGSPLVRQLQRTPEVQRRPSGGGARDVRPTAPPHTPKVSQKAMASLVIQKNLVHWWTHSKTGLIPQDATTRPFSSKSTKRDP